MFRSGVNGIDGILQAVLLCLAGLNCVGLSVGDETATGALRLEVRQSDNSLLPCRVYLKSRDGVPWQPKEVPFWEGGFISDGMESMEVPVGEYLLTVEKGPEWESAVRTVTVGPGSQSAIEIRLERLVAMHEKGWYGGDLHVHRSPEEMPRHMAAEDLFIASVQTWWNESNIWNHRPGGRELPDPLRQIRHQGINRFFHIMSGEDERNGGAILYHGLDRPVRITGSTPEYPASTDFLIIGESQGAWIEVEKPFWMDVPAWLATGRVDSIGIAQNHLQRQGMLDNEAWGRARNRQLYPGPHGNGLYTQDLYYRILNCGFRIPPSAGSASGVLPNPVGYNRVYVKVEGELSWDKWWEAFARGRVFVTNGPLMQLHAGETLPGTVFRFENGEDDRPRILLNGVIHSRDLIDRIELVYNGEIRKISLPHAFYPDKSGWFLIRAITSVEETFRFGSTGPWYVEFGGKPLQPDPESVRFFKDWAEERLTAIRQSDIPGTLMENAASPFEDALKFWNDLGP